MEQIWKQQAADVIANLHLPAYHAIPDVGLFLEQVTQYINSYLSPIEGVAITGSMISNYVKRGLIASPVKKQYNREQIAQLFFITAAKSVLSLEELQTILRVQQRSYPAAVAYDYFCMELENVLQYVFGVKDSLDEVGVEQSEEKTLLRNTIIAAAHRAYLGACLAYHRAQESTDAT